MTKRKQSRSERQDKLSEAKRKKMVKIINDLQKKMLQLDKLKEDIDHSHISFSTSPKKTIALVEEIKVPSLELIKDESSKKK